MNDDALSDLKKHGAKPGYIELFQYLYACNTNQQSLLKDMIDFLDSKNPIVQAKKIKAESDKEYVERLSNPIVEYKEPKPIEKKEISNEDVITVFYNSYKPRIKYPQDINELLSNPNITTIEIEDATGNPISESELKKIGAEYGKTFIDKNAREVFR